MIKIILLPLLLIVICLFINARSYNGNGTTGQTDTSFLKYIDTNRIVYDSVGNRLKYHQYAALLTDGKHLVVKKDEKLRFVVIRWHMERDLKKDSLMLLGANMNALSPKSNKFIPLDRKLVKNIPANIDTNMLVYDQDKQPLRFYQYFGLIFNNQVYVEGKNKIYRFSEYRLNTMPKLSRTKADSSKRLAEIYLQFLQADNILVIKSKHQVYLQRNNKTFLTFPCQLGQMPVGDKHQDGDKRTPEGFYKMVGKTTQLKYYKGYLISYPDSAHIQAAKLKGVAPGGGIMFHGTSAERACRKDWTNGCIALSNANMDSLFKYVMPQTPIEIRK